MLPSMKKLFALCLVAGFILALVPLVGAQDMDASAAKININTASVEQLTQLKGIGPKYAERIVEFRENHGAFKAAEDLTQIPGIGSKTLETNRDHIVVE